MIRYSHVSLLIPCDAGDAATITALLGVQPSRIREGKLQVLLEGDVWEDRIDYVWTLDSPMSHDDGDPTARLYALADAIEPFASRLTSLRPRFRPWVDVLFHVTPPHPHGVGGAFDWFRMPADLMRRFSAWNLDLSYESIWFDHPDWITPARRRWWHPLLRSFKKR